MDGIIGKLNEYKTKMNSFLLQKKEQNVQKVGISDSRERKCDISLDFPAFKPSILDGATSKVDLCGEGYAWTLIWWSSDKSKR